MERECDEPLPPSLPLLKGEGGVRKYKAFKPLSLKERGWGEVKFLAVELTLIEVSYTDKCWSTRAIAQILPTINS